MATLNPALQADMQAMLVPLSIEVRRSSGQWALALPSQDEVGHWLPGRLKEAGMLKPVARKWLGRQ